VNRLVSRVMEQLRVRFLAIRALTVGKPPAHLSRSITTVLINGV